MAILTAYDILIACSIGLSVCYVVLLIFHGSAYYKKHNHIALKQRYASIAIVEILVCILSIILLGIYHLLWDRFTSDADTHNFVQSIILTVLICIVWIMYVLGYSLTIYRFWMIRFDMKTAIATSNNQWMHIINPTAIQLTKHEWYLNNRTTFGNVKWVRNHIFIPWMIFWCLYTAALIYLWNCLIYNDQCTRQHWMAYTSANVGIAWLHPILLLIIYCKTPLFMDSFFISDEMKRLIIIYIIWSMFGVMPLTLIYWTILSSEPELVMISRLISNTFEITCWTLTNLTSAWWVLRRLKAINIVTNDISERVNIVTSPLISKINTNQLDIIRSRQLKQIF
eukprot:510810_1